MAGYVQQFYCPAETEELLSATATSPRNHHAAGVDTTARGTVPDLVAALQLARTLHKRALKVEEQQRLFLATMSHELRSPLSAMLGAIDIASTTPMDEPGAAASVTEMLGIMHSSGRHVLSVVNDVLDFSQLSSLSSGGGWARRGGDRQGGGGRGRGRRFSVGEDDEADAQHCFYLLPKK